MGGLASPRLLILIQTGKFIFFAFKGSVHSKTSQTVLLLECIKALTVGDRRVCWEDSHWFMNTATNRKAPSKLVCLPQSELCCILRAGQSELRRQQSEIPKRHFKTKRLPSNKRRHFWNSYSWGSFIQYQIKILRSFHFWVHTPFNWAEFPRLVK